MAYPPDAILLTKLTKKSKKVFEHIKEKTHGWIPDDLDIDMNSIGKKAKGCFFLAKNAAIEKRKQAIQTMASFAQKSG